MEDLAVQLFKLGDKEHKGFIVKRDMQRLRTEVELPPEQLEEVFESLDSSHNGYLTLDQFLAGVNHLGSEGDSDRRTDSEPDLSIQQLLNLNVLHKSGELMCAVRELVGSEHTWHQLLAALFSDLNQLLRQISQLEDTLRSRDQRHQDEMRRLYEELESQLGEERDRLQKQLHQQEARLRAEVTAELEAKEQQIAELAEQRDLLQDRLHEAQAQLNSRPRRSFQATDQVDTGGQEKPRCEEQNRRRSALLAERSYAEGFSHAHQLAILHEEGLVKQLRLLREMQETLRSGSTTGKQRKFSFNDL